MSTQPSLYNGIIKNYLSSRLIEKNDVYLNGKEENFEQILNLDRISMLNAFTVFLLHRSSYFNYVPGAMIYQDEKYILNGKEIKGIVINRQGPTRENVLKEIKLEDDKVQHLRSIQSNKLFKIKKPLWSFSELSFCFKDIKVNSKYSVSFYTAETVAIFSSFVTILSKTLSDINKEKDFRLCIHRVISENEPFSNKSELHYQQISEYFPNKYDSLQLGRIFPIDRGIVGLSIRTGESFLVRRTNEDEFNNLKNELHVETDYSKKKVSSFLSIPIFGRFQGKHAVNLVLYADSPDINFFDDPSVLEMIIKVTDGFIASIENLLAKNFIIMGEVEFVPFAIEKNSDLGGAKFAWLQNLSKTNEALSSIMPYLCLSKYSSFDIIYRYNSDFLNF